MPKSHAMHDVWPASLTMPPPSDSAPSLIQLRVCFTGLLFITCGIGAAMWGTAGRMRLPSLSRSDRSDSSVLGRLMRWPRRRARGSPSPPASLPPSGVGPSAPARGLHGMQINIPYYIKQCAARCARAYGHTSLPMLHNTSYRTFKHRTAWQGVIDATMDARCLTLLLVLRGPVAVLLQPGCASSTCSWHAIAVRFPCSVCGVFCHIKSWRLGTNAAPIKVLGHR